MRTIRAMLGLLLIVGTGSIVGMEPKKRKYIEGLSKEEWLSQPFADCYWRYHPWGDTEPDFGREDYNTESRKKCLKRAREFLLFQRQFKEYAGKYNPEDVDAAEATAYNWFIRYPYYAKNAAIGALVATAFWVLKKATGN